MTGPRRGGAMAWYFTALAIWRAGGSPRRLMPGRNAATDHLDGFIIGGGADIDPLLYQKESAGKIFDEIGHTSTPEARPFLSKLVLPLVYLIRRLFSRKNLPATDPARDEFEIALLQAALHQGKPILGICRGAQLINAALGGSLHREIREFYVETPYIHSVLRRKRIRVSPQSRLSHLMPRATYWVNSLHHQAIHDVAPPLQVAAREDNDLIQAVEGTGSHFLLGVQWHPEFLPHAPSQQRLFRGLVEEARKPRLQPL